MPDVHVVPSGNLWACEIDGKRRPARAAFPFRPRCGVFHGGRLDGQEHRAYVRLAK